MSAPLCNKCKQEPGHLGDSWCLSCSAVEAISGELRCNWAGSGSRQVVADILSSTVRQVRALRRLGVGEAGASRASRDAAGSRRAGSVGAGGVPEPENPPQRSGPPEIAEADASKVKKEDKDASEESEDEEEESEEEAEEDPAAPAAAPKKEPVNEERSPVPRRRASLPRPPSPPPEVRREDRDRDRSRRRERSRDRRGHHREDYRHWEGADNTGRASEQNEGKKRKKNKRNRTHRAGGKHQRLYRGQDNPYQRLHYKKPGSFWDQPP